MYCVVFVGNKAGDYMFLSAFDAFNNFIVQ